jgi:hypothetical protein
MNCLINSTIAYLVKQGKRAKAIRDYIRETYHISIDLPSIRRRMEQLKEPPRPEASN